MNTSMPEPTKVGSLTIWVVVALVAIVVIALALAMGGDDEPDAGEPVGLSTSAPPQPWV